MALLSTKGKLLWKAYEGYPIDSTETDFMPDIDAMIAFVKASTGREPDLVVGKPNSLFVERAAKRMGIPVSAMCMIGDSLYTDIALGTTTGILTILVLSGETQPRELADSPYHPIYVFQNIQAVTHYLMHMQSEK